MNSIPSTVLALLQTHLTILQVWFSDEVYRRLLSRAQDHFLVRLNEHLDMGALEKACGGFHHTSGAGAPPTHRVSRLVRALLLKYLFNLSLRQLEAFIQWNLLARWFAGYGLFEAAPDHATLSRFEQWVSEHQHRTFFDEVLSQIDQDFPQEREKDQMGDTYAMRANAASESLTELLRHTCRLLLKAVGQLDDDGLTQFKQQLDLEALFGVENESKEFRLDPAQRTQRLQQTALSAAHCLERLQAYLDDHPLLSGDAFDVVVGWRDVLAKILADEFSCERNADGVLMAVKPLPKKQKGSYRIASASDTDATFRVHDDQCDFGFNVNLAATDTFIRETQADTGAQPDPVAIPDLLSAQQEYHDLTPAKFIYDKAAGTGKTHADVEKATNGQTQLVAPLVDHNHGGERFGPDDFVLAPDGDSLTCPNDQVSRIAYRSQSAQGRNFRFSAQQCADCPLAQQCRGDKTAPTGMRQVFITDFRSLLDRARTYAQTDAFQQDLTLRATIERIIANLTRYHGARDARRRGLDNADFQAKMCAMAFNIRQWMRLLDRQPLAAEP